MSGPSGELELVGATQGYIFEKTNLIVYIIFVHFTGCKLHLKENPNVFLFQRSFLYSQMKWYL